MVDPVNVADEVGSPLLGDALLIGMFFKTTTRETVSVLPGLLSNFLMTIEIPFKRVLQDEYGSTDMTCN